MPAECMFNKTVYGLAYRAAQSSRLCMTGKIWKSKEKSQQNEEKYTSFHDNLEHD